MMLLFLLLKYKKGVIKMAKNSKDFLVSVADVAFYVDGALAFTGTTALNTSISVSMEDQEVTSGRGA